jgi:hypothetical protein
MGYAPPGEPIRQPTAEEIQELHSQAEETHRRFAARVRDIEKRHGDVLRRTAADLVRVGTATLRTSVGDMQARIIPFPREAVVGEIHYPGGGRIQARSSQLVVGEQAIHQLADALASIRPDAEPIA